MSNHEFEIDPSELDLEELKKYRFIDIRHPQNVEKSPINALEAEKVPYYSFSAEDKLPLDMNDSPTLLCCDKGMTSLAVTQILRQKGFDKTYSLKGGYNLSKEKLQ